MGESIEKILKKTGRRIEERIQEEKYEQMYLKDLEINEPVNVSDDAFPEASRIKAKDVEAGETAFWAAVYCEADKVKAGKDAFWVAKQCLVLGTLSANKEIGEYSRAVVLLGEVRGEFIPQ